MKPEKPDRFYKQNTLPDLNEGELPPLPKQIGPYKIEGLLNKGGMSVLYLAVHPDIPHPIAVKVLLPKYFKNEEIAAHFLKEAEIIKMVSHPNIVRLYESGEWEKGFFIAMEFVQGVSLRQFIQQKSLSNKRALEVILQTAFALHHLHTHGIIHRDLKPENIIITETGQVKLVDFGIAHLTAKGSKETGKKQMIGTPVYMSPEQKEDPLTVTPASDVYSLGVVAYELVLGKLSHGKLNLSLLPKPIAAILAKAVKPKAKERLQGMAELITDISEYIQTLEGDQKEETPDELLHLIQKARSLFVPPVPKWNQLEIGMAVHEAEGFPTHILDFFHLSDNRYCILLAEPLHTGGEALLDVSTFRGMVKMAMEKEEHPVKTVQALNRAIHEDAMGKKFSLSLLLLTPGKNLLSFISCGRPGLWHIPEGSKKLRTLNTPNPVLGEEEDVSILEMVDNWESGDTLVFHTLSHQPTDQELSDAWLLSAQTQAEKIIGTKRPAIVLSIHRMF